jgi:HAE1 family hydrophobic/amphiphilic exporter-1
LVSITLTPMIAAHWLDPAGRLPVRRNVFERGFDRLAGAYGTALDICLRFPAAVLLVFIATVVGTLWMLQTIPKSFLPQEDIGQIAISVQARPDISFSSMAELQGQAEDVLRRSPHVEHVLSEIGGLDSSALNESSFYVELKGKSQRPAIDRIMAELRHGLATIPGIEASVTTTQHARMGGGRSRGAHQFVVQSDSPAEIAYWTRRFLEAMEKDPAFSAATSDLQDTVGQISLDVDGDKASLLGISSEQIRTTLYNAFGGGQVATIYHPADSYKVFMQINPAIAPMAERLEVMHVRSDDGALVPLSAIASFDHKAGLRQVNQVGSRPAVTVFFELGPGTALGDAMARIEEIANEIGVPVSVTVAFGGGTRIFREAMANQGLLLAAAVFAVYIVLGVLYESLVHPLTILTGLPAAAVGALGALMLFDMDLSLMALIGILILVGLVKKNAIMMIDVALVLQREGTSGHDAMRTACLQRFRPIMMTTLAAIAGALPIAVGYGTSSELRQPLGVAVAGGLAVSQLLTLFITPVIFLYMDAAATRARALLRKALRAKTLKTGRSLPAPGGSGWRSPRPR